MFYKSNLNASQKDFPFSANGSCTTELTGFTGQFISQVRVDVAHSPCILKHLGGAHAVSWPAAAGGGACWRHYSKQIGLASLLQAHSFKTGLCFWSQDETRAAPSTHKLEAREAGRNSVQCNRQRCWRSRMLETKIRTGRWSSASFCVISFYPLGMFVHLLLHLTPSFATTPTLALFYLISLSHLQLCPSVIVLLDIR